MRIQKRDSGIVEGDLTPMIDMTFQLIAFFMVLINLNEAEQNQRVMLPDSVLAKPPETAPDFPITLHVTEVATVILAGQEIAIEGLKPYLDREADDAARRNHEATVIIRAHKDAQTGKVQQVIAKCQESKLEKFVLKAKENQS